jgi:hypothetical protein
VALGYRYSRKTILFFVLTKNAGSTTLGEPYHMKYTNSFGNVCTQYVDRPQVISNFSTSPNKIDTHNQLRHDCLRLEKKWITQDPFFHLRTTLVGINVMCMFLLANHHKLINYSSNACEEKEQKISIQRFSGLLANQLIELARKINDSSLKYQQEDSDISGLEIVAEAKTVSSSPTFAASSSSCSLQVIRKLSDASGDSHHLVKYPVTKDNNYKLKGYFNLT